MPDRFKDLGGLLQDLGRHLNTWAENDLDTWAPLIVALIALAGALVVNRRTLKASAQQTWQQIRAADDRNREQLEAAAVLHREALTAADWRQREQVDAAEAQHRDEREDAYRADVRGAVADVLSAVRGVMGEARYLANWEYRLPGEADRHKLSQADFNAGLNATSSSLPRALLLVQEQDVVSAIEVLQKSLDQVASAKSELMQGLSSEEERQRSRRAIGDCDRAANQLFILAKRRYGPTVRDS